MANKKEENRLTGLEIAVIGMSGRFPAAANINEFWENLKNGIEGISFFPDDQLLEAGVSPDLANNSDYVKANAVLKGKEYFDSSFFGYTPREAEVMHPQLCLFHETSWHALEDAGYDPFSYNGLIGVYAGSMNSFDWQALSVLSGKGSVLGGFAKNLLHNSDLLTHRISHKLDLKGPSFTLFTACSTSLVAIHLACRGLITGECSMALAGGVSASVQQAAGYMYEEDMIWSPDGHCRTFDARSNGTFFGEGIGVVVLKRANEAIADRDHIYALVKGSAINNDGINKVDFAAPSIKGQVSVIKMARKLARVTPESISYIEAHGTGTKLGDPIEISALKKAFPSDKKGYCGIGSVKSNIGHLEAAAGVSGFIKTVLALTHKLIPPSLHFENPNPEIDFENGPFYVNTKLTSWENDEYPLRAGVSSFGIGGTNAHVILEEAPGGTGGLAPLPMDEEKSREYQLILLSAKTEPALEQMTQYLANHLKENPGIHLADAAYTLQLGRKAFKYRRAAVCSHVQEAIERLVSRDPGKVQTYRVEDDEPEIIFMFPGQGAQYVNMGLDLYRTEPVFREEMDRCFEILNTLVVYDIKEILYPDNLVSKVSEVSRVSGASNYDSAPPPGTGDSPLERGTPDPRKGGGVSDINQTEIAQPLLFVLEYALAKLLMKWGVEPHAMIGHSIGEYAAACLSGVLSLEDALTLVVLRGRLMQEMPGGSMLSAAMSEEELTPLLESNREISLAAVNAPCFCVVSGTHGAMVDFEKQLKEKGYETRLLHTSHAFHSPMMDPILREFAQKVKGITLNEPKIPYISNVTGKGITAEQAMNPWYWADHLRKTVYFSKGIGELLKEKPSIFVEVGPAKALRSFVRQHIDKTHGQAIIDLVRHPKENVPDHCYLLNKIGQLWLFGKKIAWTEFYAPEKRQRISLPPYPFEGQKYWIDPGSIHLGPRHAAGDSIMRRKPDMADWFYIPLWEQALPAAQRSNQSHPGANWLLFVDRYGLGDQLGNRLEPDALHVVYVRTGEKFSKKSDREYIVNPAYSEDYHLLFKELRDLNKIPHRIVHSWSVLESKDIEPGLKGLDQVLDVGLYSLLNIVQALGRQSITGDMDAAVVTNSMWDVLGEEDLCPARAALSGAVKVIPLEYSNIRCRSIDIVIPRQESPAREQLYDLLWEELLAGESGPFVALRGNRPWQQRFKAVPFEKAGESPRRLREEGVYLITGGLGGIGFTLAQHLAKTVKARLVLTARSPFPPGGDWDEWLASHDEDDAVSLKIREMQACEAQGARFMVVSADAANPEQMQAVFAAAVERFGCIHGVIHAAGVIDYAGVIQRRNREMTENSMAARVKGTLILDDLSKDRDMDFFILFSSIGNILYKDKFAQVSYVASNEFLESFALYKAGRNRGSSTYTAALNWPDWLQVGMVMEAFNNRHKGDKEKVEAEVRALANSAISPGEGVEIFDRILEHSYPRVYVSPLDLEMMVESMNRQEPGELDPLETLAGAEPSESYFQRPELTVKYAAPGNETEKKFAEIFQKFLGIQQVGIHDDFFELGGNSLIAAAILSFIRKHLHVKIPLVELFNRPTIAGLVGYLGEAETISYSSIRTVEKKEYYVCSPAQQRLYVQQQIDLVSTAYNTPVVVVLEGGLEKVKVENTCRKLISRHESLRTSFEIIGGEPVQFIHNGAEFEIESNAAASRDQDDITSIINNFERPFDLSRVPLMRVGLIDAGEEKHILMLDMHHIVCDGISSGLFVNDFKCFYRGEGLPKLRIQYKDFSEWQNSKKKGKTLKQQEEYWLNEFAGEIPTLDLPTDFPRPETWNFEGDIMGFEIDRHQEDALKKLAAEEGATFYMVLFTLFNVFLAKITGQEDIIVGTVAAGRTHPDLGHIIGMFVNTLALRNFPGPDKSFRDFLGEVKDRTLQAFENQDYQLEDLVDKIELKQAPGNKPLISALFSLQNIGAQPVEKPKKEGPGLKIKNYPYKSRASKFDLMLEAIEQADRFSFTFEYRTKLFKKETIERFTRHFKEMVSWVQRNPDQLVSEIEIIRKETAGDLIKKFRQEKDDLFIEKTGENQRPGEKIVAEFDY